MKIDWVGKNFLYEFPKIVITISGQKWYLENSKQLA